jgi:hypothetical protein
VKVLEAPVSAWQRFWFEPVSTSTLAVFRIAVGILTLFWATALADNALDFFSPAGVLPVPPPRRYGLSLLALDQSSGFIVALFVVLIIAAVCLIAGYQTRIATGVAFVIVLSLTRRNEYWVQGGDVLLRIMLLFLFFAPAGAALSLDRWRRDRANFWTFPARAPWALRLLQIQLTVLYLFAVWSKVQGERWNNGTAIAIIWLAEDVTRFQLPYLIRDNLLISNLATYGTLVVELAMAVLIWNRRLRPWVMAGGIALHLFIEVTFALAWFPIATVILYITFVPPDVMDRWIGRRRERSKRSRFAPLRRFATAGEDSRDERSALIAEGPHRTWRPAK